MALKFSIDFITKFLEENSDETLKQKWVEEIPRFKKTFKKSETKSLNKNNGPKKNKSAYNIFCSKNMKLLKDEFPDLDNKELFSEMAKRWKKVKNTDEFTKYQNEADKDKERYIQEKGDLNVNKSFVPKKPSTAYMLFCSEERKHIQNIKGKELMVELGVKWQKLKNDNNKTRLEHYQKLAEEDKNRYKVEKENYKGVVVVDEIPDLLHEDELVVKPTVVVEEEKPKKKQTKKNKEEVVKEEVVKEEVVKEEVVKEKKVGKAKKPSKK